MLFEEYIPLYRLIYRFGECKSIPLPLVPRRPSVDYPLSSYSTPLGMPLSNISSQWKLDVLWTKYDFGLSHGPTGRYHSQGPQWKPLLGGNKLKLGRGDRGHKPKAEEGHMMPGDTSEADEMNGKKVWTCPEEDGM